METFQRRPPADPPPPRPKQLVTDLIALTVYWPLFASPLAVVDCPWLLPLSYYRHCSFYTMRTDARDRFGTPLEQRFSRAQISQMCISAGLVDLRFSSHAPYWCVVASRVNHDHLVPVASARNHLLTPKLAFCFFLRWASAWVCTWFWPNWSYYHPLGCDGGTVLILYFRNLLLQLIQRSLGLVLLVLVSCSSRQ